MTVGGQIFLANLAMATMFFWNSDWSRQAAGNAPQIRKALIKDTKLVHFWWSACETHIIYY